MKTFEFLITDRNGNTRTETVASETIESAYSYAISLFANCDVRLRRDIEYRWWYLAAGFAAGSVVSAIMLYVLTRNLY